MRITRTMIASALCALASLLLPGLSHALFHISAIDEVLASLDGDNEQQFIEIEMLFGAQNLVSNAVIAAFDADGAYVEDILVIPSDLANGTNGARWTVATEALQSAQGFSADFTMPARIPLGGGMICWGAPGLLPPADPASWDHTDPDNYVDCLAYGTYAGPSNHFVGNPTTLVAEGHSLVRVSETDDNAADFACADTATPTNNAGQTVEVPASTPCEGARASGIQLTPDEQGVLVNKDVGDQRWTITRNLDDLTVTGNVFSAGGGDPLFLFCVQQDQSGDDLELRCSGADSCSETSCPAFAFIADVTLPLSFFTPPVDTAPIVARIGAAIASARGAAIATPPAGHALGVAARASGIQITPNNERVLINKDVTDQRWSITRNLNDLTVTGNVFLPGGGDPLFLFCEQLNETEEDVQLRCSSADGCSETACPSFEFIADVTLPLSFFAVPGGEPARGERGRCAPDMQDAATASVCEPSDEVGSIPAADATKTSTQSLTLGRKVLYGAGEIVVGARMAALGTMLSRSTPTSHC